MSHSAGCLLSLALFREHPQFVPGLWVTCGTYPAMLGADQLRQLVPGLAARVAGAALRWPAVPWVNVYKPEDPWGAPLASTGAPCHDVPLEGPRAQLFEGHGYWDDPGFAQLVARAWSQRRALEGFKG